MNNPSKNNVTVLIETLKVLICDEKSLTNEERKNLVQCVAILGALSERTLGEDIATGAGIAIKKLKKEKGEKKVKEPNPVFPSNGKPWLDDDINLIKSIIEDLPDDDIQYHIVWLSEKLGRTPYAIAMKIVSEGRCNQEWAKQFKPLAKEIREEYVGKSDSINQ